MPIKGTLSYLHKKVKFKVSWLSAFLSFNLRNSDHFHPNEQNEMSQSKLGSPLFNTKKNILEIEQKGFCSIVNQTHDLLWDTLYGLEITL